MHEAHSLLTPSIKQYPPCLDSRRILTFARMIHAHFCALQNPFLFLFNVLIIMILSGMFVPFSECNRAKAQAKHTHTHNKARPAEILFYVVIIVLFCSYSAIAICCFSFGMCVCVLLFYSLAFPNASYVIIIFLYRCRMELTVCIACHIIL